MIEKIPVNTEEGMRIIQSEYSLELSADLQNLADIYVNDYVYGESHGFPIYYKAEYTLEIIQKIMHKVKPILPNSCLLANITYELHKLILRVDLSLDLQFRFAVTRIVRYNLNSGRYLTTFTPPDRLWFTHPELFDYQWHSGVE